MDSISLIQKEELRDGQNFMKISFPNSSYLVSAKIANPGTLWTVPYLLILLTKLIFYFLTKVINLLHL